MGNETTAREEYCCILNENQQLYVYGAFIYHNGFLAASPDGIIKEDGTPVGILKIKCPFTHRNSTVADILL